MTKAANLKSAKAVFGQGKATMFEMNKLLSPHLKA